VAQATGWLVCLGAVVLSGLVLLRPEVRQYALPSRAWLHAQHFPLAVAVLIAGIAALVSTVRPLGGGAGRGGCRRWLAGWLALFVVVSGLCGLLMLLDIPALKGLTRLAYTGFDPFAGHLQGSGLD
jgi:hypothetical protein